MTAAYSDRIIRVKHLEALEGFWWQKTYEAEGWVGVELVGPDKEKYKAFHDAVRTIEEIVGLPEKSLWKLIEKIRPDVVEKAWIRVYLRGAIRKDQVEE